MRDHERGSAVVEFALLLPVVLLVLIAVVQVGVVVRDRLLLSQAARAGAREAAVEPSDGAVREAVFAAAPDLDESRLSIVIDRAGERGAPVTVALGYETTVASLLVGWLMPSSVELHADATTRQEFG